MRWLTLLLVLVACGGEESSLPDCAHVDEDGAVVFGEDCSTEVIEKYLLGLESVTPTLRFDAPGSPISDPTTTPVG